MSIWRELRAGFRALVNRRRADEDLADEVRDFFEHAVAAHRARGLSAEEARRAAQREIGNATVMREQARSYGWENAVESLDADLRYAFRRLRANPGFTAIAVVTLGLGIGASTAIFSAVYPILFEPLPYPDSRQLVSMSDQLPDGTPFGVTYGNYREVTARARSFERLAASNRWEPTYTAAEQPERFDGLRVTAGYFQTLGVAPALGRDFDPADDHPQGARTVILTDALWRRVFGGDSAIVGKDLRLNDVRFTIIGVLPRGFESVPGSKAQLFTLLRFALTLPSDGPEWGHNLRVIGRVRPGVSLDEPRRELARIGGAPVAEFARPPWSRMERGLVVSSLHEEATRGVKPALLAVLGAVALVLLIACVNVTNLLLARGAQRRAELALRAALGAERGRLVRQLLIESLSLATIGGLIGIAIAWIGVRGLVALAPTELPRAAQIGLNAPALLFALAVTTVVGIAIGIAPALASSREGLATRVQDASRRTVGGHTAARRVLVVAEVALAVILLANAGLLLRSLQRLFSVDPGFASSGRLTMRIQTDRFATDSASWAYFRRVIGAVKEVPGVSSFALSSQLPLSGDNDQYGVHFEDSPTGRSQGDVYRYAVTPDFFTTLGIPVVSGRAFTADDRLGSPPVAVINERFARRKFPAGDAVGKRLRVGADRGEWLTIVGIARDVRQVSLAADQTDAVYLPLEHSFFADPQLSLIARVDGDPMSLASSIKSAIWSVDSDQPIVRVQAMDDIVAASIAERKFALVIFEVFAIVALLLAATGIYGVLSASVTERTRELGVRSALGASSGEILAHVMRQGVSMTAVGAAVGVAGAMGTSALLASLLFGVSRTDAVTYAGVLVLLSAIAAIACWIPAARAARLDPLTALRSD